MEIKSRKSKSFEEEDKILRLVFLLVERFWFGFEVFLSFSFYVSKMGIRMFVVWGCFNMYYKIFYNIVVVIDGILIFKEEWIMLIVFCL